MAARIPTLLIVLALLTLPLTSAMTVLAGAPPEGPIPEPPEIDDPRLPDLADDLILDPLTGDAQLIVGYRGDEAVGLESLLDPFQGSVKRIDEALSFAVVTVPEHEVEPFLSFTREAPLIDWAKPDGKLELYFTPDDPLYTQQWGPSTIGMEQAWDTTRGSQNITVSVVDTGIAYDHPDLEDNVCEIGPDFGSNDDDPYDTYGHGTHVAGTVAATMDNNIGVAGMADACLMAVKIEAHGGLTWSAAASGVQWSADNGANVIQMSWGGAMDPGAPLSTAIANAHDAGVLLVAAAGNSGCNGDTVGFPAAYPQVVAVAALAPPDGEQRAYFSSCGPGVEIAAPGENILSTVPSTVDPSGYRSYSGTSMASPHASGVAALFWAEHEELSAGEVRCILAQQSLDLGPDGRDPTTGFGRINASAMLDEPGCMPTPPEAPALLAMSGDNSALLGWRTPFAWGGVDGYHLYRGDSPGQLNLVDTLGPVNAYEDTNTTPGETYYYALEAFNEAGNSSKSETVEIAPVAARSPPETQDWENGLDGWSADGLWGLTQDRSSSGDHSAYFGIELGDTPDENTYDTGRREVGNLTSPPIDLRNASSASLSFWSHHEMEGLWWEHPSVQISTPDAPGEFETLWSIHLDHSGGAAFDLTPWVGQVVHLRFFVDTIDKWDNDHEGWYVDDLVLSTDPMEQYAPGVEIVYPTSESYQGPEGLIYAFVTDPNGVQDLTTGETRVSGGDWREAGVMEYFLTGNYSDLSTGSHEIQARITDKGASIGTDSSQLNVDADPPEIEITSPAPGTQIPCSVTVTGTASDTGGSNLSYVLLYANGEFIGFDWENASNWSIEASLAFFEPGSLELNATVRDHAGNHNSTIVMIERVEADCQPQVAITSPEQGVTIGCTFTITGNAQSAEEGAGLDWLEVYLGNAYVGGTSLDGETNTTWSIEASVGRVDPGPHQMFARVYDESHQSGTSTFIDVQRSDLDCRPQIEITAPTGGSEEDCILEVSLTHSSPYGASIDFLEFSVDDNYVDWAWVGEANGTIDHDLDIGHLSPGAHSLSVIAYDENHITNESAPRAFERSDALCEPRLTVTTPQEGETVRDWTWINGTAEFPEEGLGVPTQGQLEIIVDGQQVYHEDVTNGDWSVEWNTWAHENGPLEVNVALWMDDSYIHDGEIFFVTIDNREEPRLEASGHGGNIGCSLGLMQVSVSDRCGTNDTVTKVVNPGLTTYRVRLSWEGDPVGVEYLSMSLTIGGEFWQATASPGDNELVLEAEAQAGERFTDEVLDGVFRVRAGYDHTTPAVAVDVDYEIEATWGYYGAELPEQQTQVSTGQWPPDLLP